MAELDKFVVERLGDDNYPTWAPKMKWMLVSKDLWAAVGDAAHEGSAKAQALIGLHVRDQHVRMVMDSANAKAAWDALQALFAAKSSARRLALKRDLNSLQLESGESVSQYVARARDLRDFLAAAGSEVADDELIMSLLAGLPDDYSMLVTALTTRTQELEMADVLASLLQFEQQVRRAAEPGWGQQQLGSQATKMRRRRSWQTGGVAAAPKGEQMRGSGRGSTGGSRAGLKCHYCGKLGHFKADCHKRKEDERRRLGPPTRGPSAGVALSAVQPAASTAKQNAWVLDSGATSHMTGNRALLCEFAESTHEVKVTYGNGQTAIVGGVGSAHIRTAEVPGGILLRKVLYVPEATYNLLSVPQAVKSGAEVLYSNSACQIRVGNSVVAQASIGADGLCYLGGSSSDESALVSKAAETAALWHRRFGHLGYENLARMVTDSMVTGISVSASEFSEGSKRVCEPCVMAKQHREPFPQSSSSSTQPLQLVHMDVCGPIQTPSLGRSSFFCTFLDDYSKLSVVQPVARKSDVAAVTRDVFQQLETLVGSKVRTVRTDGGGEYVNAEMDALFRSKGIRHQKTVRYTPQQNGAAERLNRTLMERVRAMLSDSALPNNLWAEAVVTANYIRNRSPVTGASKTPWELFHGSKPDVSKLRTFGACAYAHVPDQLRRKLDSKAQRGVMVGYAVDTKGYRILLDRGGVVISRDVVFDEGSPVVVTGVPTPAATAGSEAAPAAGSGRKRQQAASHPRRRRKAWETAPQTMREKRLMRAASRSSCATQPGSAASHQSGGRATARQGKPGRRHRRNH